MADCYKALGIAHRLWSPIPGQFDDYIATPKKNLYQSLHTTVICDGGHPLEVQIKTDEMHRIAEYGVAAHWRYKEGAGPNGNNGRFEERMTWLRQLLEWQRETPDTNEFLESVREDLFRDQVFVYTPKGDIMELTAGATPIDFAYKIHTDLGHRISGPKSTAAWSLWTLLCRTATRSRWLPAKRDEGHPPTGSILPAVTLPPIPPPADSLVVQPPGPQRPTSIGAESCCAAK